MYCSTGTVLVIDGPTGITLLSFYINTIIPELKELKPPALGNLKYLILYHKD
jgi:hypothetical protein